ncbi:hypothetical protein [Zooshikella sp. RANM57]|uniref:hypothetical protein n=1 Tax=Zooshikella sp. RANM57 TaxID=3425863 RepID=UPI003D6EE537
MKRKEKLLERLNAISKSLASRTNALGLLALGSVGVELGRLDDYSDLDFFVIVRQGFKQHFIQNLDWLSLIHPIIYSFQNTKDGHKVMFADEIYAEFAVFEPYELNDICYSTGRIIWAASDFQTEWAPPKCSPINNELKSEEWIANEIVSLLYVGMCRQLRGETFAAYHCIQIEAFNLLLELFSKLRSPSINAYVDIYNNSRRVELRYPEFAAHLPQLLGGIEKNTLSAKSILEITNSLFPVNKSMKDIISNQCLEENNNENM